VPFRITPDPNEEERRAILAALELERRQVAGPSARRRHGYEPEADDEAYATEPRRKRWSATPRSA
jgi:hypothetical protein